MKNLRVLIFSLIFLVANYIAALADLTASAPSNMISSIASSSSFTSLDQNSVQAQNVTDNLLDSEQLQEAVEDGAETFGAQQNDATLEVAAEEQQLVALNSTKVPGLEYPEPNLDTIIYDTGLMTLAENTSAQYNGGLGDSTDYFSGEQKARVKVYIDFVRQKQWGFVESHITLKKAKDTDNNEKTMINIFDGGAQTVTKLPVEGRLIHTISSSTGKPLNIDFSIDPAFGTAQDPNDESPFDYDTHSINSVLQDNSTPTIALYQTKSPANFTHADRFARKDFADTQKSISHGGNNDGVGDMGVLVQAKFNTGAGGAIGTSTASFEISNAAKCGAASGCTSAEIETIKTSIIRLEATATTRATKYTGE
jgi:hypothetical protein